MRWQGRRQSENVIDQSGGGGSGGGGRRLLGGGGLGTVVIAVALYAMGVSPGRILGLLVGGGGPAPTQQQRSLTPEEQQRKEFVSVVLGDTEEVWGELFRAKGSQYVEPHLVLFSDEVRSGCGLAGSATGPFYCPPDQNLYLDLNFFDEMANRLNAPGDFAQAYVIGHEVGHHVQNLTGVLSRVNQQKQSLSEKDANALQVKVELQADYFAGVWAHHAQKRFNVLEPGDIEEALQAASAVGDDTLQRRSQGYVVPDSFTHGSSAQRVRWFKKGFESGDMDGGDTFSSKL